MASNSFGDNTGQFNWLLWQLGIGSMACLFCAVFFGLKFKWFRAQLNLGESKSGKAAPVQGIGFKLKANPDDFQSYKVISEFAPVPFKPAAQNGSLATNALARSLSHTEEPSSTKTKPSKSFENNLDAANTSKSKSMEQLSSHTPQTVPAVKSSETGANIAEVTNPMFETQNSAWRKAAEEEEENWGIKFVDEKASSHDRYADEPTDADDSYFTGNSKYSSQAASIFFGDRSTVAAQNSTRNNHLRRNSDNESIGSDTSA